VRKRRRRCRQQAFLQRAGPDARRIELLHELERRGELLHLHVFLGGDQRGQFLRRVFEVTGVAQLVDHDAGQGARAFGVAAGKDSPLCGERGNLCDRKFDGTCSGSQGRSWRRNRRPRGSNVLRVFPAVFPLPRPFRRRQGAPIAGASCHPSAVPGRGNRIDGSNAGRPGLHPAALRQEETE
jgi:hypothetical protein